MAALTWRNVDAPNFSGANDMWRTAATLMNQGFDSARRGINDFRDITRDEQSSAMMQAVIAAGNDPTAIQAAVAGGNAAYMSPEALKFANNQQGVLLERENLGLRNRGQELANVGELQNQKLRDLNFETKTFDFGRTQLEAQREDQRYAAMPGALAAMAKLRTDMGSTDPAVRAAAEAGQNDFFAQYGQTLGLKSAADVASVITGNIDQNNAVMQNGLNRLSFHDQMTASALKGDANGVANNVIQMMDNNPDRAIKAIQGFDNLSPELKTAAVARIEELRAGLPKPSAAQSLLDNSATFRGQTPQQPALPSSYQPIVYQNGGKRSLPVNGDMQSAFQSVLPSLGLTAVVTSGGQSSAAEFANGTATSNGRTGSTRHDHGGAADVMFRTTDGRILDWNNPGDVPQLQAAVSGLKGAGLTGFGAGPGYMNSQTTHVGYGAPAVWGAEGGRPYQALLDAYSNATSTVANARGPTQASAAAAEAAPQYQAAMDAVSRGENYEAPINPNRTQMENADGTISTEQTITTEIDGAYFNIPTVVDGKKLPEQEALEQFRAGTNPAVGVFQTQQQAETAAQARSDEIGRALDRQGQTTTQEQATAQANENLNRDLTPTLAATTDTSTTATTSAPAEDNFPKVDPNATAYVQSTQQSTRDKAINNAIADLTSSTGGGAMSGISDFAAGTWDYFMATPAEGEANAATRTANNNAGDILAANADYFRQNPSEIAVAKRDPVAYAQNFGQTPSQRAFVEANQTPGERLGAMAGQTPSQTPANQPTPVVQSTPQGPATATTIDTMLSQAAATADFNQVSQGDRSIYEAIQNRSGSKESAAVVAARLTADDGPFKGYPSWAVTKGIQDVIEATGIESPAIAGEVLQSHRVAQYNTGWNPLSDTGWGSGFEINSEGARNLWNGYQRANTPGAAGSNEGIARLMASDATQAAEARLETLQTGYREQEKALMEAIKSPDTTSVEKRLLEQELQNLRDYMQQQLQGIMDSGLIDPNLRRQVAR